MTIPTGWIKGAGGLLLKLWFFINDQISQSFRIVPGLPNHRVFGRKHHLSAREPAGILLSLPSTLLFTHLRMRSSDSRRQMRHPKRIRSDFRVFVSRAERDLFLNERNIKRANRTNRDASRQLLPAPFYHHIYAGFLSHLHVQISRRTWEEPEKLEENASKGGLWTLR